MLAFASTVEIDAPPEAVWSVLVNVKDWSNWEPNIKRVEGQVAPGEKVTVHTTLSERAFPVTISQLIPNEQMVWSSTMPLGMFNSHRTFTLTATQNKTIVHTREEFSGFLLPLFKGQIGDLQPSFDTFAQALKDKVESTS